MKIGEYRTNGKQVAYRRDANTLVMWADAESASTSRPITDQHAEILTHGWRTMTPGEVALWCASPAYVTASDDDDWIGMYNIASKRADAAEAEVKALRATIAKARTHLHPGIQLSNASYQEGYRYAAAQVLAILEVHQ